MVYRRIIATGPALTYFSTSKLFLCSPAIFASTRIRATQGSMLIVLVGAWAEHSARCHKHVSLNTVRIPQVPQDPGCAHPSSGASADTLWPRSEL